MRELRQDIRGLRRLQHVVVEFSKPDHTENVAHLRLFVHEEELPQAKAILRAFIGRKRMKVNLMTLDRLQAREFNVPGESPPKNAIRMRSGAVIVEGKVLDIAKMYTAIASLNGVRVPPRAKLEQM